MHRVTAPEGAVVTGAQAPCSGARLSATEALGGVSPELFGLLTRAAGAGTTSPARGAPGGPGQMLHAEARTCHCDEFYFALTEPWKGRDYRRRSRR